MTPKDFLPGLVIGGSASATIFASGGFLYGWSDRGKAGYELSDALNGCLGPASLLLGAAVLVLLSRYSILNGLVSMCVVPLPLLSAIALEMYRSPTSHNLIPFELIPIAAGTVVLHLPAMFFSSVRLLRSSSSGEPF